VTALPDSTRLLRALRQTVQALDERVHSWALIGGLAVSIRGAPLYA
jgi:hypothetical protein